MDALFKRGVLVQIKVGQWSMEVNLDAEDIDKQESEIPGFARLGFKRLFPKETRNTFSRISGKARSITSRYGFDFFLTGAYFVPNDSLERLLPQLEALQMEYYTAVEGFLYRYDDAKVSFLNEYPEHRANLAPFYPSVDTLRSKFFFNVWCYQMASSPAIPVGEFGGVSNDTYVGWATDAVNSLRDEAREVAKAIGIVSTEGSLDGRNLRRVTNLVDRLAKLDLLEDADLLKAARRLTTDQTGKAVKSLVSAAKRVTNTRVRKLLLD